MRKILRLLIVVMAWLVSAGAVFADAATGNGTGAPLNTLGNSCLCLTVDADAHVTLFQETASGTNLLKVGAPRAFAHLRKGGRVFDAARVSSAEGRWNIAFPEANAEVVLAARAEAHWLEFEVLSVRGEGVEELTFLDVPLNRAGTLDEAVAACALALNLKCQVPELPGPMTYLQASCYARFGMEGAKVAVLAAPATALREIMKEVVNAARDLPHSSLGGPWALDAPINRGSYLIDYAGQLGEDTVDAWVDLARNLGMGQIDFHPGTALRFGDLVPNPKNYPRGLESVKSVVDKLHAAGIAAGLHTYAFFVAKDSTWVSPVPDAQLAADRVFTLAGELSADATTVPVVESTAGISAVTGFQVRNSATLRIGDELIAYAGVQTDGGFAFTGCTRHVCGTAAAAHAKDAKVEHLKECFGLFVPDGDSPLFTEVAARTAEVYNTCGFDMIYLDALDGSDILAGGENAWHYGAKFVFELEKRLARPALFEMSALSHHMWYARSRMGAWDVPARAFKSYVDIHARANEDCARRFLPAHLGWWGAFDWSPVQPERTFPEDMEYVCGKCIGNGCGLSLLVGFTPDTWAKSAHVRQLGGIVKAYEDLRLSGKTPDSVKKLLRAPASEFRLERNAGGQRSFRAVQCSKHTVAGDESREWTVNNRFGRQEAGLRIEALMSAAAYDAPGSVTLAGFTDAGEFTETRAQQDVTASLEPVTPPPEGAPAGVPVIAACSARSGYPARESAWALAGKTFAPPADLSNRAIGLWVHGDGQGEVLNVQLKSTAAAAGGISEHYVKVDFTGWRYCLMVEPESENIARLGWPYSSPQASWGTNIPVGEIILDYNLWVDYGRIESVNLWWNNLPVNQEVHCLLSPVRALPLQAIAIRNPAVTVGGKTLVFPVTLESGAYIEFRSMSDCTLYDAQGNAVSTVLPTGGIAPLEPGENTVRFSCDDTSETAPLRARVTVTGAGESVRVD